MSWKRYSENEPDLDILVNVFRHESRKYVHAKLALKTVTKNGQTSRNVPCWFTQHKHTYPVNKYDAWQSLDFYVESNIEITYRG